LRIIEDLIGVRLWKAGQSFAERWVVVDIWFRLELDAVALAACLQDDCLKVRT